MLLTGFSMGGEVALWLALKGLLPAHGFILLAPGGPFMRQPELWLPLIQEAAGRELRGYIVFSEDDPILSQEGIRQTATLLNENGFPTRLETRRSLAHEYPPDFDRVIQEAIDYIGE
jgi:pimeloyl-ACP methyl ester carboxylesterase